MRNIERNLRAVFCALALIVTAQPASAATVTLIGDTVIYEYDTVVNADALLLLGAPTISGDAIRFLPPDMRAESTDGAGEVTVTADFLFSSVTTSGADEIIGVAVTETGDYEIMGGGSISAALDVEITNNANLAEMIDDSVSFAASGDSGGLQTWQLDSSLNPAGDFAGIADDISLLISNTLTATSDASGEFSWVQTKLEFAVSTTAGIALAEPGSLGLFALGLAGALYSRRRRAAPATR